MSNELKQIQIAWKDVPADVQRMAIAARKIFLEERELQPIVMGFWQEKEMISPVGQWIDNDKNAIQALMMAMASTGARLVCLATEAWAVMGAEHVDAYMRSGAKGLTNYHGPGKTEVISLTCECENGNYLLQAAIHRKPEVAVDPYQCLFISRDEMDEQREPHGRFQDIYRKARNVLSRNRN